MTAPCGVELEIGQVWIGFPDGFRMKMTVIGFDEAASTVAVCWEDGVADSQPLDQFRADNRGGYRLIANP